MASDAQVRYAKSLLSRECISTIYVDTDTPTGAASWLIDRLKHGEDIGPDEWEAKIKEFSTHHSQTSYREDSEEEQPGAKVYDKSIWEPIRAEITSPGLKIFFDRMITVIPGYFYRVPASSTGKYHPKLAQGDGGLVRHTMMALKIGREFFANSSVMAEIIAEEGYIPLSLVKDIVLIALSLHDTEKHGSEGGDHTIFIHPLLPRRVYQSAVESVIQVSDQDRTYIDIIFSAIESHMGPWNMDKYSSNTLPTPKTRLQMLVHICDYIASRKFVSLTED